MWDNDTGIHQHQYLHESPKDSSCVKETLFSVNVVLMLKRNTNGRITI